MLYISETLCLCQEDGPVNSGHALLLVAIRWGTDYRKRTIHVAIEPDRTIRCQKETVVFDSSRSAGHLVSRAQRLFAKESDQRLKPLGLSSGYIPVILSLAAEPVLTQKALVQRAAIEQPTMAATLARMERDGLVERRADRKDARTSLFRLTRLAKSTLPQFFEQLDEGNAVALAGLTVGEREQLLNLLTNVIRNLGGELPESSPLR
jgi:MarR family transcriptional regulator for hemolysin